MRARCFLFGGLLLALSSVAHSATWYVFNYIGPETIVWFFDADTIQKNGRNVTIWLKYVKAPHAPDKDGSYSTTQRTIYDCAARTRGMTTYSTYDKGGDFIETRKVALSQEEPVPGSVGESLLKQICAANFPVRAGTKDYELVDSPEQMAKRYFDTVKDPAPR